MEWFSGNIPQAIQLAKNRKSIFIVYITGEDEATKEMDKMWEEEDVVRMIQQQTAVAIKIQGGSEACTFFSQIYPVVLVPSAYFIGNDGVPLEVVGGSISQDTFTHKVQAVLQNSKSSEASSSPSPSPAQQQQQQQQTPAAEAAAAASPSATTATLATASLTEASTSSASGSDAMPDEKEPDSKKPKVDVEERVQRAKQLIEQKRIQKAQEEAEKERAREIERRRVGQSVQQLKQKQQEREVVEVKQQLSKDKEEERAARQRVKDQIEQDRADRNARYQQERAAKVEQQEAARKARLEQEQQAAAEAQARRSETARIQFRLPDGSSVSNQFPSSSPLQVAADFASAQVGGAVTLSTAFPRRTFSQSDMAVNFMDLQLAPSAVVIVVPASGPLNVASGGSSVLSFLFAPLMMLWNFLMSFFSSGPPASRNSNNTNTASPSSAAGGDRVQPSGAVKRSRQEGNIRRLRNMDDDDDENATWNGNSTQQM